MEIKGSALNIGNSNVRFGEIRSLDTDYYSLSYSKFNRDYFEMLYYKIRIFRGELLTKESIANEVVNGIGLNLQKKVNMTLLV
jgi:hypothetical protein